MGRSSDLEAGGGGFDSRLAEVILGSFFVNFGMSWDVSGSGQGMFLDRFGMVWEKMYDRFRQSKSSKLTGSIFPESGRFRIAF